MKKEEVFSRGRSFAGKLFYVMYGVFASWSLSHYYVNFYGGEYPNVSVIKFIMDLSKDLIALGGWAIGMVGVPGFIALYQAFRSGRRRSEKR